MNDNATLVVCREISGIYESVGSLASSPDGACFAYEPAYLAKADVQAISVHLPLRETAFDAATTKAFFDGLTAEGPLRAQLSNAFHIDRNDYQRLLARLNNESAGALVFVEKGTDPARNRRYEALDFSTLENFAATPRAEALGMGAASRLSLAGAQAKIGLHHEGDSMKQGWLLPKGSAPSTYIVKAADGTFAGQTVNEALCMTTARLLGFDAAECVLVPVQGREPLLAVKRFDRVASEKPFPLRLHQEDLCQALGWPARDKYEKTDGHYVSHCANLVNEASANPFGDRQMFFSRILLDWAMGNCDNHLKNHSLLWDESWSNKILSPLYDVTCTTIYPALDREMGVSPCPSRRVDDVTFASIFASAKEAGVPRAVAENELKALENSFVDALLQAEKELVAQGFDDASRFARHIEEDFVRRFEKARKKA